MLDRRAPLQRLLCKHLQRWPPMQALLGLCMHHVRCDRPGVLCPLPCAALVVVPSALLCCMVPSRNISRQGMRLKLEHGICKHAGNPSCTLQLWRGSCQRCQQATTLWVAQGDAQVQGHRDGAVRRRGRRAGGKGGARRQHLPGAPAARAARAPAAPAPARRAGRRGLPHSPYNSHCLGLHRQHMQRRNAQGRGIPHPLAAKEALDGSIFQGRLLHVLPAHRPPPRRRDAPGAEVCLVARVFFFHPSVLLQSLGLRRQHVQRRRTRRAHTYLHTLWVAQSVLCRAWSSCARVHADPFRYCTAHTVRLAQRMQGTARGVKKCPGRWACCLGSPVCMARREAGEAKKGPGGQYAQCANPHRERCTARQPGMLRRGSGASGRRRGARARATAPPGTRFPYGSGLGLG